MDKNENLLVKGGKAGQAASEFGHQSEECWTDVSLVAFEGNEAILRLVGVGEAAFFELVDPSTTMPLGQEFREIDPMQFLPADMEMH